METKKPASQEPTPFERMKELTRRIVRVPKSEATDPAPSKGEPSNEK
jgi:hypothetical protein